MLLQLIANDPQAIRTILTHTPVWVWGLLTALLALGFSQLRRRQASLVRVGIVPIAMVIFSIASMVSAFWQSPNFAFAMLAWLAAAAAVLAMAANGTVAARYDSVTRTFDLPGSAVPLALIVGIFMIRYLVNIELALQPTLAQDPGFTTVVAALYGAFNGLFAGRAARLFRLAFRPAALRAVSVNA